jgi:hypothetical protein
MKRRLVLVTRPGAHSLAVSGMPRGSLGMDGRACDNRQDPYDVLLIARDDRTTTLNSYFKQKECS